MECFGDGIVIVEHTGLSIAGVKNLANGASVGLASRIVTAIYSDCIYVEEAGRSSGIKVIVSGAIPTWLTVGATVDIGGVLNADSACERRIDGVVSLH